MLRDALFVLAFSFIDRRIAQLSLSPAFCQRFYKIAAVWLGFLNYILHRRVPAPAGLVRLTSFSVCIRIGSGPSIAAVPLFSLAALMAYMASSTPSGFASVALTIHLPDLPSAYGVAAPPFCLAICIWAISTVSASAGASSALATGLNPEIVFIPGDLFDGGKSIADRLAEPLSAAFPAPGHFLLDRQPR